MTAELSHFIGGRRIEADVHSLDDEQELIIKIDGYKAAAFNITGIIPC